MLTKRYSEFGTIQTKETTFADQYMAARKRTQTRRIRGQTIVLSLALLRFFLLGILELNNQINRVTGQYSNLTVLMSAFSYAIFGQIIDNHPVSRQKRIFLVLEISMGAYFLFMAYFSFFDAADGRFDRSHSLNFRMEPLSYFFASSLQIMITLQLFNWFSKRVMGTVLGIWFAFQSLGLVTKFLSLGIYQSYFPDFELAEIQLGKPLILKYGWLQLAIGCIFLFVSLFDHFYFIFHPFEVAVVVDLSEKRERDRQIL